MDFDINAVVSAKDVLKLNGGFINDFVDDFHVQSRSKWKGGTTPLTVTGSVQNDLSLFVYFYPQQSRPIST